MMALFNILFPDYTTVLYVDTVLLRALNEGMLGGWFVWHQERAEVFTLCLNLFIDGLRKKSESSWAQ